MTRAQRLKALVPLVFRLYAMARCNSDEHRAVVLLQALGIKTITLEGWTCPNCAALTVSEWLRSPQP